ncbi:MULTISPECIES: PTS galactosamine/N-acetylgalactosamine transporter subunit IIA [unclassified Gilliamella]|uniref:PTS galactosamine/N-acetylgalactosamine transporter subunit IIA n=1 Tax=unclassified Gilliamella TaxID=2685620 RepID=UPI0013210454|nr:MULTISPECIES: PTS galactosamine/N-acetylgalactosamine transporter subunit IIA [unclassified Gilliamella]MWN32050.1 PTS N-acetylgalactosamine transporter subunit IIA [Gilliamella sp. Pra-s60]MWP29309.1 PTS N-acetylgalactosamine transporter subunit IIA [Gilliamella sp. Pra-s54]
MIGIILTGHGSFATGLYQAATQIIGEQTQFCAVDFPDGMSSERLEQQLSSSLKQCDKGDGVIFLTDIIGGSPFRLAATLSLQLNRIEVISGINMPLLLEVLLQRNESDIENIRLKIIENAKHSVNSLWHEQQKKSTTNQECLNGI